MSAGSGEISDLDRNNSPYEPRKCLGLQRRRVTDLDSGNSKMTSHARTRGP